jgi:hypothetical protein
MSNYAKKTQDKSPGTFKLSSLNALLEKGRTTIQCHQSGDDIDIRRLIDGVIGREYRSPGSIHDHDDYGEQRHPLGRPGSGRYRSSMGEPDYPFNVTIQNVIQQEQHMSKYNRSIGDQIAGDKVAGNKMHVGMVHGDAVAGNKTVTVNIQNAVVAGVRSIIEQLAVEYPTTSSKEKLAFGEAVTQQIAHDPALSKRLLSAVKAGGVAAIEQALNHPLASFVMAAVQDWCDVQEGSGEKGDAVANS